MILHYMRVGILHIYKPSIPVISIRLTFVVPTSVSIQIHFSTFKLINLFLMT